MHDAVTSSLSSTVGANSGTFQTAAFKHVIGLAEKALFRCCTTTLNIVVLVFGNKRFASGPKYFGQRAFLGGRTLF